MREEDDCYEEYDGREDDHDRDDDGRRKPCKNCRDDDREDDEEGGDEDGADVDEKYRDVETKREAEVRECQTRREGDGFREAHSVEDDEDLRVRKERIDEECEEKIDAHADRDIRDIFLPECTHEKESKCEDGHGSEEEHGTRVFAYRPEVIESLTDSETEVILGNISIEIAVDETEDSSFGDRM